MQVLSESYKPVGSYLLFITPLSGVGYPAFCGCYISVWICNMYDLLFSSFLYRVLIINKGFCFFQIAVVRFTNLLATAEL